LGKLELEVVVFGDSPVRNGIENIKWPEVLDGYSKQISQHVGPVAEKFTADFSTTTSVERSAFSIVLMNAMRRYFDYTLTLIICGIPQITLEGNESDWQSILDRVEAFTDLELDWWLKPLRPVLRQFEAASRGNIDRAFWANIYRRFVPGYCMPETAVGWYTVFFPYIVDVLGYPTVRNPWMAGKRDLEPILYPPEKLPPEDERPFWEMPEDSEGDDLYRGFFDRELPLGVSMVPLNLEIKNLSGEFIVRREMEFISGFTGISQDNEILCLRPEIGWAVYESGIQTKTNHDN
jgi:hypothetical protein